MIKRKQRLPPILYLDCFKKGRVKENDYFRIFYKKNDLTYCRFGVVVSNKIFKKAVKRNKLKRQIKAMLKDFEKRKKVNYDLLVVVKKAPLIKFKEIKIVFDKLLESLNNF